MTEIPVEDIPVTPELIWNGVPLFSVMGGIRLIEYCENHNVAVLGIEGFRVNEGSRIPVMDCIVDFSASLSEDNFSSKSLDASRKIINSINDSEILMEFVLVRV